MLRPRVSKHRACSSLLMMSLLFCGQRASGQGDLGNGKYSNPVLFSDYSDPDVIRVGNSYYLVASSFHFMPGVPVLRSEDMVNWRIVSHVFPHFDFSPIYSMKDGVAYAKGAWAPSIRYHAGRFYVYFPTPTEGIFMSSAPSAEGPWEPLTQVIAQAGLEDPCPLWDDDGKAYLVHSKTGAGPLILHAMSPDGKHVLDEGKVIVNDPKNLPTLEGPKLYKRNGWYYIFAPFGGVGTGAQTVLRAKNIYGPYEQRAVLAQGSTTVNGPHQGGYIETPGGQGWFMHFSQRGGYGRIAYLEPVKWHDDWPVIGKPVPGETYGEPVSVWPKPNVGRSYPAHLPQTSDEFTSTTLGLQWEWNHNPDDSLWSLKERKGFLRLHAGAAPDLIHARNTLTQQMQSDTLTLTTRLDLSHMADGQRAGLAMFGVRGSWIGVEQADGKRILLMTDTSGEHAISADVKNDVQFRMRVANEHVRFAYSVDGGKIFTDVGGSNQFFFSWWKAARPAIFTYMKPDFAEHAGALDVDWVRVENAPANHLLTTH